MSDRDNLNAFFGKDKFNDMYNALKGKISVKSDIPQAFVEKGILRPLTAFILFYNLSLDHVKKIFIRKDNLDENTTGQMSYDYKTKTSLIEVDPKGKDKTGTIVHEIQHVYDYKNYNLRDYGKDFYPIRFHEIKAKYYEKIFEIIYKYVLCKRFSEKKPKILTKYIITNDLYALRSELKKTMSIIMGSIDSVMNDLSMISEGFGQAWFYTDDFYAKDYNKKIAKYDRMRLSLFEANKVLIHLNSLLKWFY